MHEYGPQTYGERIAGVYDDWYADVDPGMIAALADLAGDGSALELGIGSGRVALPLAERGIAIQGIDASPAMIARLRSRPGGREIAVHVSDFGEVDVPGPFRLVYVVFNTFFGLLTQDAQVRCFQSVAARLEPGGTFALELFVPDLNRFARGQCIHATRVETDEVSFDLTRHDPIGQRCISQHVHVTDRGVRLYPVQVRYAWPGELDLMARIAGLRLRHRWGGWDGSPFTAASTNHISIYERPV